MGKMVVVGATGAIGRAAVAALSSRHEVIEVGTRRGTYQVDAACPQSVQALFQTLGKVDGVVVAFGSVHFGPLDQTTHAQFMLGLRDKLMGQVNLVLEGQAWMCDGGSFTLTGGVTAHQPVREGTNASTVNMALEGFVRGAAIDLQRGMRINLVSPTVLDVSADLYAPYFPGFEPVASSRVGLAYVRSVEGAGTGQVYRVGY